MRPVERGPWPTDDHGEPLDFSDYKKALTHLVDRCGGYCSYCGMRLDGGLHVEHVRPKKPGGIHHPDRERDWDNFLLGCPNCNSTKGDKDISLADHVWPDTDNTLRAFSYGAGGMIMVSQDMKSNTDRQKIERTMMLTGLDRFPGGKRPPELNDRRWSARRDAWDKAVLSREDLQNHDNPGMRQQIIRTAIADGYWSIWYTVLKDDADMRRRLVEAAVGTAKSCFDADYLPVPRPGGAL